MTMVIESAPDQKFVPNLIPTPGNQVSGPDTGRAFRCPASAAAS